jgi:hypothetical protein
LLDLTLVLGESGQVSGRPKSKNEDMTLERRYEGWLENEDVLFAKTTVSLPYTDPLQKWNVSDKELPSADKSFL